MFCVFANQKKRGARLETIEQIEQRGGMRGRGPVIDREPDFRLGCFKRAEDRTEPLAVWNQRPVEQQNVGKEDRGECDDEIHAHEKKSEERRAKNEREDRAARSSSVVMAGLDRHCQMPG